MTDAILPVGVLVVWCVVVEGRLVNEVFHTEDYDVWPVAQPEEIDD